MHSGDGSKQRSTCICPIAAKRHAQHAAMCLLGVSNAILLSSETTSIILKFLDFSFLGGEDMNNLETPTAKRAGRRCISARPN